MDGWVDGWSFPRVCHFLHCNVGTWSRNYIDDAKLTKVTRPDMNGLETQQQFQNSLVSLIRVFWYFTLRSISRSTAGNARRSLGCPSRVTLVATGRWEDLFESGTWLTDPVSIYNVRVEAKCIMPQESTACGDRTLYQCVAMLPIVF